MNIDEKIHYWLHYQSSLTESVVQAGYDVQIVVLKEQWLNDVFKRDVIITCDNKPCWYGRTIIPLKTFLLKKDDFYQLGNTPIGTMLFHSQDIHCIKRRFFKWRRHWYHQIKPHQEVNCPSGSLWGRATTFHIKHLPLFLMELFLPEVCNLRRGNE